MSQFSLRGAGKALSSPRAQFGVLLPLIVVIAFSVIFVRANPDLYHWIDAQFRAVMQTAGRWLSELDPMQWLFWLVSGWIAIGLFYPAAHYMFETFAPPTVPASSISDSYIAVRNMMISVVLLFAVYLAFEFATLWFREFPKAFIMRAMRTKARFG